jgi:FAD/FMN-containing dehydrogenase
MEARRAAASAPTGGPPALEAAAVADLRAGVRGAVLEPTGPDYDAARAVWNGMIDRRPALIVRCAGTADVVAAVALARERGLPLAVRGGGHNVAGHAVCDGGVVVDLSALDGVRVDPARRTVRVGGGARLGDVDRATQEAGLAVPLGVVSRTGVAGLALHGGLGFLTRKYGLTADNLVAAEVVTADGRVLTADADHHPELLWALRGGGGNFGVVTAFEFRAHPVGPEVWVAVVFYPVAQAPAALAFFREFMAQAPDELMALAVLWNAPTEEPIPEAYRGAPVVVLFACHAGPVEAGEAAVRPFREVATPVADLSGRMPYVEVQQLFDPDYPDGRRYYWKSAYLRHLDDEAIRILVGHAARRPSPLTSLDVWALGGAMGRVGPAATPFARRDAPFLLGIEANWEDPAADAANIAWAREVFGDTQRFSPGGAYLNFPGFGEEGTALVVAAYGDNYARLREIKAAYDPGNLFRHNLNIPPGP